MRPDGRVGPGAVAQSGCERAEPIGCVRDNYAHRLLARLDAAVVLAGLSRAELIRQALDDR